MTQACHCPGSYPDWNAKDIDLSGHAIHSIGIPSLLHMPLSYDLYLQKQQNDATQLELEPVWPGLVLTRTGLLRGKLIYLLKSADSPSRFVDVLPQSFTLRGYLHEGGIGTIKQSVRELQATLFDMGRLPKELYLCYLTCPNCYEQRGGEKILMLRRWVASKTLSKRITR